MLYINKKEYEKVIDEETHMTYGDWLEIANPYEEIVVIDEVWGKDNPNYLDNILDDIIENELEVLDIDDIIETYLTSEHEGKFFLEECIITRLV